MPKTLIEYKALGYPDDYLKTGDLIDYQLATFLTRTMDIEDQTGAVQNDYYSSTCGNTGLRQTIYRKNKRTPWEYIGEATTDNPLENRAPAHARMVFVCSAYRNDDPKRMWTNVQRARTVCRMIIKSGDLPVAPHLYFGKFLNDYKEEERDLGVEYGLFLLDHCDRMLVIKNDVDEDAPAISKGMTTEIEHAIEHGMEPEYINISKIEKMNE